MHCDCESPGESLSTQYSFCQVGLIGAGATPAILRPKTPTSRLGMLIRSPLLLQLGSPPFFGSIYPPLLTLFFAASFFIVLFLLVKSGGFVVPRFHYILVVCPVIIRLFRGVGGCITRSGLPLLGARPDPPFASYVLL